MRELRFRAWNIPNKYMYYDIQDGVLAENEKWEMIVWLTFWRLCKDKWSVVMRYTWLKDNNWKSIYEGDIIFANSKYYEVKYWEYCISTPEWFWIECIWFYLYGRNYKKGKECFVFNEIMNSAWIYWEIIWNIYETPELLKKV
jgi:uncharacterized phage protein (TIGR01671 family)